MQGQAVKRLTYFQKLLLLLCWKRQGFLYLYDMTSTFKTNCNIFELQLRLIIVRSLEVIARPSLILYRRGAYGLNRNGMGLLCHVFKRGFYTFSIGDCRQKYDACYTDSVNEIVLIGPLPVILQRSCGFISLPSMAGPVFEYAFSIPLCAFQCFPYALCKETFLSHLVPFLSFPADPIIMWQHFQFAMLPRLSKELYLTPDPPSFLLPPSCRFMKKF